MKQKMVTPRYTLYLAEFSDIRPAEISLLEELRQKKILYAVRDSVKTEQLLSGSFLRECLTDYGVLSETEPLSVYYNFKGKPYPESRNYYFNLSHSGEFLAAVVSREEIGVDIEERKPLKIDLSGRILNESERLEYAGLPEERKNDYLISVWTRKESIAKCLGEGITARLWEEQGDNFLVTTTEETEYYVSVCLRKTPEE